MAQPVQTTRAQAGLAQVWLGVGNAGQAVAQVESILPQLEQRKQHSGAELYETLWICYQVLTAVADPRCCSVTTGISVITSASGSL
ncbi:MAG: hypothetical protein R3E79_62015 [Caldilineaceae bacterium]